jgi:hypothetical protein
MAAEDGRSECRYFQTTKPSSRISGCSSDGTGKFSIITSDRSV